MHKPKSPSRQQVTSDLRGSLVALAGLLPAIGLGWFVGDHVDALRAAYLGDLSHASLEQAFSPLSLALAGYTLVLWLTSSFLSASASKAALPHAQRVLARINRRLG